MSRNVWIALGLIAAVLAGLGAGLFLRAPSQVASHPQVPSTDTQPAAVAPGEIKIWVPTGATDGNKAWVYVDGHIEGVATAPTGDWLASPPDQDGVRRIQDSRRVLTLQSGDFTDSEADALRQEMGSQTSDAGNLFALVDLQNRPPGDYVVEVAYLMPQQAFPFAITRKYDITVQDGQTTQLFVGIPNDWSTVVPARRAPMACTADGRANVGDLQQDLDRYARDPTVHALRAMELQDGASVIDLPPENGGPREFDRAQIGYIANAVLYGYAEPSHADVGACKESTPQFAQSFEAYERLLGDFDDQLRTIRALAQN
jgi:hypothetical protein